MMVVNFSEKVQTENLFCLSFLFFLLTYKDYQGSHPVYALNFGLSILCLFPIFRFSVFETGQRKTMKGLPGIVLCKIGKKYEGPENGVSEIQGNLLGVIPGNPCM